MKAIYAVVPDQEMLEIRSEEIDPSQLQPYEILVGAEASVISPGTELAIFTAVAPGVRTPGSWNAYPWRPGYGLVGHVVAAGGEVDRIAEGDRVFCFGKHASLQRYDTSATAPMTSAFAISDRLPAQRAAMARMALVALTAPQVTDFEAGDTAVIFGLGLVGNLAAQLYQIAGARVIGLDVVRSRCEMASKVGIQTTLDVPPEKQVEAILNLTGGKGAAIVVDAVGHSAVIRRCIDACATFGQVILLGSPRTPYEMDSTQILRAIHNRWLTVRGALEWRLPPFPVRGVKHSIASNLDTLLDWIESQRLDVDTLITHVIKPDGLQQAYQGLLNNKETYLGVVIDWQDSTG